MIWPKSLYDRPVAPGPPAKSVSPENTAPSDSAYRLTEPGECPGVWSTASRVPATSNEPPRPSSRSGTRSSYSWAQSTWSAGCRAISRVGGRGHLDRRVDVVVVPVGADHGDDAAVPHRGQDRLGVVRGVDHQHLVVVADQPDVVVDLPLAAVQRERPRGDDLLDPGRHQSTTTERRTSPRCIFSNAASTSPRPIVSDDERVEVEAGPGGTGRSASGSRGWAGSRRTSSTSARRRDRRPRSSAARWSGPASAPRPARRCRPGRGRRTPARTSRAGPPPRPRRRHRTRR